MYICRCTATVLVKAGHTGVYVSCHCTKAQFLISKSQYFVLACKVFTQNLTENIRSPCVCVAYYEFDYVVTPPHTPFNRSTAVVSVSLTSLSAV